jgi:hypothetical protein
MVINFAVEGQNETTVAGMHGLMSSRRKVENGEATMPKRNSSLRICPHPCIVWTPMPQLQRHSAGYFGKISTGVAVWRENSCQAAHLSFSS